MYKHNNFYSHLPETTKNTIQILTRVTGGSNSLSLGTSIQVISTAPVSPGEHGVNKSSTILLGSVGHGPLTFLKCVAVCTFLTGCIKASRTTMLISAPEYLCHKKITLSISKEK